ncbi:hypothetical protein MNV49_002767 [Pseudohyphozyma bogoriensis]|nr:hypothetical protein MNV49_002767 [Pseudohyphozyma bogoriensis]
MPPKSILKKRPAPAPTADDGDDVIEVPKDDSVPAALAAEPEPESEDESDDADADSFDEFDGSSDEEGAKDDDDEQDILEMGQDANLRPAKKLKHTTLRPTAAPSFSLALNHLLSLPPSASSLAPKRPQPSAQTLRLERRARSLIRETKASHLARGHVKDVIAGWGSRPALPFSLWESESARRFEKAQRNGEEEVVETGAEREKRLRKLAQRGVVRLFNAISAAQGAPEREEKKARKDGGSETASVAATEGGEPQAPGGNVKRRPNVLGGRGKAEGLSNLSKASFLDLIRAGTTTSVNPVIR